MQQFVKSSNDESSDEEEDMMVLPAEFVPLDRTEKCEGWVQCDICDEYICPKCHDKRHFRR